MRLCVCRPIFVVYAKIRIMSKNSEKGLELTDRSWATALLWFDIETLARDGSYEPESHYQAIIMGKPLAEYRNMTDEEIIATRDFLASKTLKEQLSNGQT